MAVTLQECINNVKKEYPNYFPKYYVEFKGAYVFCIFPKTNGPVNGNLGEYHIVDPETGEVTGAIPIQKLYGNKEFMEIIKHPNEVAFHDQELQHSLFLSHHGIKGQSWGERNGPPYPLSAEKHNEVVSGKEKRKKNDKEGFLLTTLALTAIINNVVEKNNHKKRVKDSRELSKLLIDDIADVDKQFSKDNPPRKIEGEHSIEDDMAAVNPKFDVNVKGTTNNCVLCSYTYEMRRRGYDVTANCADDGMYTERVSKDIFDPKPKKESFSNRRSFEMVESDALKRFPEGSRGQISIAPYMQYMCGHSMCFEIRNHKLVIIDAQSNKKTTLSELKITSNNEPLAQYYNPALTTMRRTDNLEINFDKLNEVCSEYREKKK